MQQTSTIIKHDGPNHLGLWPPLQNDFYFVLTPQQLYHFGTKEDYKVREPQRPSAI